MGLDIKDQKIELPTLPAYFDDFMDRTKVEIQEHARAAIEADRQQSKRNLKYRELYIEACQRCENLEAELEADRQRRGGLHIPCQGTNCGAINGSEHSPECIAEAAEAQGWADAPEAVEAKDAINRRGEPDYYTYVINGHHRGISETAPPDDAYDEGTLQALYTAPQPAEPKVASSMQHATLTQDERQLVNWLLRDPTNGERLVFASAPVNEGSFAHVRMRSESGEDWTLTARLKQGWLTAEQRAANFWDAAKAELEDQPAEPSGAPTLHNADSGAQNGIQATQTAEPVKVPSDADIDAIFYGMPNGVNGWLKDWGYRQFARALLARYGNQENSNG